VLMSSTPKEEFTSFSSSWFQISSVVDFKFSFLGFGIQRSKKSTKKLNIWAAVETIAYGEKNTKQMKVISPHEN